MWVDLAPPLRLEPAGLTVASGQQYTLTLRLDEVPVVGENMTLNSYQFSLSSDPALVRVDDVAIRPGYGALGPHVDAASGQAASGAFHYGVGPELAPGASLATVTVSALGDGYAAFSLSDVQAVWVGPSYAFYLPLVLSK
jgi:hypothetical protein